MLCNIIYCYLCQTFLNLINTSNTIHWTFMYIFIHWLSFINMQLTTYNINKLPRYVLLKFKIIINYINIWRYITANISNFTLTGRLSRQVKSTDLPSRTLWGLGTSRNFKGVSGVVVSQRNKTTSRPGNVKCNFNIYVGVGIFLEGASSDVKYGVVGA